MNEHLVPEKPTISVITPAYNSAECIADAIQAVSQQSLAVEEHIIIDDGSTDSTTEVVASLKEKHPHLKLLSQKNLGAAAARNAGIEAATGEYIAFLDSDDNWSKNKLMTQISYMVSTGASFTYGDYRIIGDNAAKTRVAVAPQKITYQDLLRGCPIGCLTVAFNQWQLGKHYMPDVRRGQDWGLWLKLARIAGEGIKYPGVEAIYVKRPGSLSKQKLRKLVDVYNIYRTQEDLPGVTAFSYLLQHVFSKVAF